jgi:hypothetical protein
MDQDLRARMNLVQDALRVLERDGRSREATLGLEIRRLELEVRDLRVAVQQSTADVRDLARKVEEAAQYSARVSSG